MTIEICYSYGSITCLRCVSDSIVVAMIRNLEITQTPFPNAITCSNPSVSDSACQPAQYNRVRQDEGQEGCTSTDKWSTCTQWCLVVVVVQSRRLLLPRPVRRASASSPVPTYSPASNSSSSLSRVSSPHCLVLYPHFRSSHIIPP